jgi:glycosyltransferase involved in cell wall biosynthesis
MNTARPTVSVVVASYNYARYLPQALDSVLAQTRDDWEVLVVDDGSTDNTREVVRPYLADDRFRYLHQDNAGQAAAKNRGATEARGELVAFLDADDVWLPSKLDRQIPLFADPGVGVVYAKRLLLDAQGRESPFVHPPLYRGEVAGQIFMDNFLCFSSTVVRRGLLELHGGFDESLRVGIDFDLWIRLSAHCAFDYVDEVLVKYRVGHERLSSNLERRLEHAQRIMRANLDRPGVARNISRSARRRARGMTGCSFGNLRRDEGRRLVAAGHYALALALDPASPRTWREAACLVLPPGLRRRLKALLAGRPAKVNVTHESTPEES